MKEAYQKPQMEAIEINDELSMLNDSGSSMPFIMSDDELEDDWD